MHGADRLDSPVPQAVRGRRAGGRQVHAIHACVHGGGGGGGAILPCMAGPALPAAAAQPAPRTMRWTKWWVIWTAQTALQLRFFISASSGLHTHRAAAACMRVHSAQGADLFRGHATTRGGGRTHPACLHATRVPGT